MSIIPTTSSGVIKMEMEAYEDLAFSTAISGAKITAQMNPETIKIDYKIDPVEAGSSDSNAATTGDSTYTPPGLGFQLTIDDTGVFSTALSDCGDGVEDIETYIALLKKVVYNYVDATHGPPYVSITWGSVKIESTNLSSENPSMFKGQLESMSVEYKLFSREGKPVRAVIDLTFKAMMDPAFRPTGESPDLTHIHQVQMGDNLPMLSQKIYNKPSFYMQLARVNGLSSIYQLKPGVQLVIPPLEKTSR